MQAAELIATATLALLGPALAVAASAIARAALPEWAAVAGALVVWRALAAAAFRAMRSAAARAVS
jgi:hypothetical protein